MSGAVWGSKGKTEVVHERTKFRIFGKEVAQNLQRSVDGCADKIRRIRPSFVIDI
jgi:hypothetical protein